MATSSPAPAPAVVTPPYFAAWEMSAEERWGGMSIARGGGGHNATEMSRGWHAGSGGAQPPRPGFLRVDDIAGAVPRVWAGRQRPTFHDTGDIDGAAPHPLPLSRTGHHDPLAVDDIDGARARTTDLRTKRVVDPLNPVYPLPSAPVEVIPSPPFKRDSHRVDDIPGARPVATLATTVHMKPRDNLLLTTADVPGAQPRARAHSATGHHDTLDVADITANPAITFKTSRITDPQRPTYTIHGMEIKDAGARPPSPPRPRPGSLSSLTTGDIPGAQPLDNRSRRVGAVRMEQRTTFLRSVAVDDIPGARAGTLRRGLSTTRTTNPNEPRYPMLDKRALEADEIMVGHSWYVGTAKVAEYRAAVKGVTGGSSDTPTPTTPAEGGEEKGGHKRAVTAPVPGMTPALAYATKLMDPRELELARLRGEVEAWRSRLECSPTLSPPSHSIPQGTRDGGKHTSSVDGASSAHASAGAGKGDAPSTLAAGRHIVGGSAATGPPPHPATATMGLNGAPVANTVPATKRTSEFSRMAASFKREAATTAATAETMASVGSLRGKLAMRGNGIGEDAFNARKAAQQRAADISTVKALPMP